MKINIQRNCKGAFAVYRIKKNGCMDMRNPTPLFQATTTELKFSIDIKTDSKTVRIALLAYAYGCCRGKDEKIEVMDGDTVQILQGEG